MNVRHSRCILYFTVPLKHENIVWEVERNESLDDPIKRFCLYCYCFTIHHKSYSNADKWPINRLSMRCSLWIIRDSVIFKSFFSLLFLLNISSFDCYSIRRQVHNLTFLLIFILRNMNVCQFHRKYRVRFCDVCSNLR